MDLIEYRIGRKYKKWEGTQEGLQINFNGAIMELVYKVDNPTAQEQQIVMQNSLIVAFCVPDNIPFILVKFEGLHWMDAPFYPNPYPQDFFNTTFPPGKSFPLAIYTVDTRNGELLNIRMCGLATLFWNELFAVCRDLHKLPRQTRAEHRAAIDNIYERYKTSEDMLSLTKPQWISSIITQN